MKIKLLLITVVLVCTSQIPLLAGSDSLNFFTPSPKYNPKRTLLVVSTNVTIYTGTLIGLNELWYRDYPRSRFHFFNDNNGWLQQDKIGHFYSAYFAGNWGINLFKWAGTKKKKAVWIGGSMGSVFLTTIEILDGFSAEWGASPGDLIANSLGSFLVIAQELAWDEQKAQIKFSFHPVNYDINEKKRAEYLYGKNIQEQIIKDYNGQTCWLSLGINSIFKSDKIFPQWFNLSFGYSPENMMGAERNLVIKKGVVVEDYNYLQRYRQYFLSMDIDLTKIQTKSPILKTIFTIVNILKFPAPALELRSTGEFKFHPVYY